MDLDSVDDMQLMKYKPFEHSTLYLNSSTQNREWYAREKHTDATAGNVCLAASLEAFV